MFDLNLVIHMDEYETLSKIGDGTFGTVYLCKKQSKENKEETQTTTLGTTARGSNDKNDNNQYELVAIKKMKKRYYNWDECLQLREIKALKQLNHKNIILLKEVIRENNHLFLVFEHMEENLYQLMRRQLVPFAEKTIRDIVLQILNGLAYIHKHGFFHRDIKPENLLCRNGPESIKIADFGLTREILSEPPFTDYVSTRWYRAPELLLHSTNYSPAVDIWAVGCISGELYTLRPMFPGRSEIDQIFKICQVLGSPNATSWPDGERLASLIEFNFPNLVPLALGHFITGCSQSGINMIRVMLKWAPGERPKARDLLNDCYFKE